MPDLEPDGSTVDVGTLQLRTPGISGRAEVVPPAQQGTRLGGLDAAALDAALERQGVATRHLVEVDVTDNANRPAPPGIDVRRRSANEPVMELEVPFEGDNVAQVVLSIDEQGLVTWNLPVESPGAAGVTRGGSAQLFQIRSYSPRPDPEPGMRGVVGFLGKKMLRVLAFPIVEAGVSLIADDVAGWWEERNRPYRARTFAPDSYTRDDGPLVEGDQWRTFSEGPALLILHGTFSRAHTGFDGIPPADLATLHQRYGGRVFAFDHFTLAHDPVKNVEELVSRLPADATLELDILSHSRGGLVGRVLAERQSELSLGARSIKIRRHVFAAGPNAGTVLADTTYLGDLVDSYTNMLQYLPSNGVTETLEAIVLTVKHIAAGAVKGLPGLQAMLPGGPLYQKLNGDSAIDTRYFALAANYEPTQAGFREWAQDRLRDAIFKCDNDLVVPTAGVYDENGNPLFAIDQRKVFNLRDGVWHSGFFQNRDAMRQVLEWLPG